MACNPDESEEDIENLKTSVRKSFAHIFASLKARELKTLRQLDAIRKQCQDNKELERNCVQNINIRYSDESSLLDIISKYGVIDFEKLSFDNSAFLLEDYISPNDDHMYLYKTLEGNSDQDVEELEAIEEAAIKQIIETEDCVCYVTVQTGEVSHKFREVNSDEHLNDTKTNIIAASEDTKAVDIAGNELEDITEVDKRDNSDRDVKKINPTDDWLNSIKNQTETEPTQVTDVMEHSTITCT